MATSLYSALSGLQVHQQWINVLGNNLANSNTPGYKTSRASFADALSQTFVPGTGPQGQSGGTNPLQVGQGVRLGSVARNFGQGALTTTGRIFDMAIEGNGFFALQDNGARVYTRVGTFGLDAENNLVDQRSGAQVLSPTGQALNLDVEALFPPSATGQIDFRGNLPAVVSGPLAEVLTGNTGLKDGTAASLTAITGGPYSVAPGSTYTMEVVVSSGAPQFVSVTDADLDGFLTATEIADTIDQLEDLSATVSAGLIQVSSDRTGSNVTLKVDSGSAGNDLASLIGIPTAQTSGSETDVSATTDLNALPSNITDYEAGDAIAISGIDTDGTPVSGTFVYGTDGTTVNELVDFIGGLYTDAQVSLNASGQLVVEAQTAGESDLVLSLEDDSGAAGRTQWTDYATSVTTNGTGPDTVLTSTEVYDPAGVAHTMTLSFERQIDGTWTVTPELPEGSGQVTSDPITGLQFGSDGAPQGLGAVNGQITVQFEGQPAAQTIGLGFGQDGTFDGVTQFGGQTNLVVDGQDGFGDGELANIFVRDNGAIEGFYTNGQTRALGEVGIATFTNEGGLEAVGGNYFVESPASGAAALAAGEVGKAGSVIGSNLENSNVDTAEQFVRLIEAQRGFQANARVITTQNEVLSEMVNLI